MDHIQILIHIPRVFCFKPRLQMCHDLSSSGHHPEVAFQHLQAAIFPQKNASEKSVA